LNYFKLYINIFLFTSFTLFIPFTGKT